MREWAAVLQTKTSMLTPIRSALRGLAAKAALVAGLLGMAGPALAFDAGNLKVLPYDSATEAMILQWDGGVARPMGDQIQAAFDAHKHAAKKVIFRINSGGGSVAEGERVIRILREIRKTHKLETLVDRGNRCSSMCVFIYLQGERRVAALSSLWLFHEVSHHDPVTKQITRLDRAGWERLVSTYFGPAGVSPEWTEKMKPHTVNSDYWQTGSDLLNDKSGIFHVALGNQRDRLIAQPNAPKPQPAPRIAERAPPPAPSATPPPETPRTPDRTDQPPRRTEPQAPQRVVVSSETKACRELNPTLQMYVNVPCTR